MNRYQKLEIGVNNPELGSAMSMRMSGLMGQLYVSALEFIPAITF